MDGASKSVRGDAIAGLIITGINIVGGLLAGMIQNNLSFSQAIDTYTILTVGDGLVSQMPQCSFRLQQVSLLPVLEIEPNLVNK